MPPLILLLVTPHVKSVQRSTHVCPRNSVLRKQIRTESQCKGETSVSCHRPSTCRSHMRTGVSLTPVRADKSHVRRWWRNTRPVMSGVSFTSREWGRRVRGGFEWNRHKHGDTHLFRRLANSANFARTELASPRTLYVINKRFDLRNPYCAPLNFPRNIKSCVILAGSNRIVLFAILFIPIYFVHSAMWFL